MLLTMDNMGKSSMEWEALCEQCGTCCFEKIEDENGTIFFTQTPCRYLDVVTRKCRIYKRRFEIYPECIQLTEDLVRELFWLHDGCAYKKALETTKTGNKRK